jgi:hypothetical protein
MRTVLSQPTQAAALFLGDLMRVDLRHELSDIGDISDQADLTSQV